MKWHYNTLQAFNKEYYHGIISSNMLSEELFIKGESYWQVFYNKKRYLLQKDLVDELPIKILKTTDLPYRNKIYHVITEYASVRITPEKKMSFKQLVDGLSLEHSNPKDFTFFKILALASEIGRLNFRISSEAGFGKDSVMSVLGFLRNNVSIINPRTTPAVEYRLYNKVLVLNELSNLESSQRKLLQELLLLVGDYKNVYEKSSRSTNDTFDTYDISKLSLVLFYNNLDYYEKIGKEDLFFDNMFTKAVKDRYLPFKLNGSLNMKQFTEALTMQEYHNIMVENHDYFVDYVRSLEWYSQHFIEEVRRKNWVVNLDNYPLLVGRHKLLFHQITDYLKLYAENEGEWESWVEFAYDKYKNYQIMVNKNNTYFGEFVQEVEEEVIN